MQRLASLLITALLAQTGLHAAVYDVGGNSSNYSSISAAMIAVGNDAPGLPLSETITVLVHGGSYSGAGAVPVISQPLVISAMAGTLPVLASGGSFGLSISGVANVLIQGLSIQGFSQAGIVLENCPAARVQLNTLKNNSTEIWLKNCPGADINSNTLQSGPSGSAVRVEDSPNSMLRYNTVARFAASGLYSSGLTLTNSAGALILKNWVMNANNGITLISCQSVTLSANVVLSRDSAVQGISLDGSSNGWIFNNLAVGQYTGIALNNSSDAGLHNNTVWEHILRGLRINSSPNVVLRNNILQGDTALFLDAASLPSLDSQYNDLVGQTQLAQGGVTVYPNLGAWQGTGNDTMQSLSSDPLFVNPSGSAALDFILQGGSPVLARGQDLFALFVTDYFEQLRPSGSAWEQGFHALIASSPTPTPTATASPVLPTHTVSPTFTHSPTPMFSATQSALPTASPTRTLSPSITPTFSPSPYPVKRDKLFSYPNPYVASSGAPLNLVFEAADDVSIRIFDIAGHLVVEIPADKIKNTQGYASWDGKNLAGQAVPVGLYLAVLRSSKGSRFTRFTVVY